MGTSNALSISRLISTSVNLSPNPAQFQNISTLLILGSSSVIDVVSRIRNYQSITQVALDFGTTSPEYLAAVLWFQQAPQPTTLSIGRWAKTAVGGQLIGATLSAAQQALSLFTAITSGTVQVSVDSIPLAVTGLNFAAATNLNGVAQILQTAIAALSAGSTVVWNAIFSRFEVTSGTTGATSNVSFFNAPTALGNAIFSANPTAADTLTINGTVITFVAGTPVGSQVQIGATLAITLASLLTFLSASVDAQLVKMTYSVVGSTLYVVSVLTGTAGNAYTLAKVSTAITVSGATLTGGLGTNLYSLFGNSVTNSGAYVANGIAAETAVQAVALFDQNFGQNWYGLTVTGTVDADHLAIAPYIEAANNKHLYGVSTTAAGVISSVSVTDIAYLLSQFLYNRTVVQYSSSNIYSVCSLLARLLTTDYNGNNTVITLMYKQEPGIVAETLNATQIAALEAKNANVFVAYNNNTAIIEKGVCSSGNFVDIITGTDWLALDIQTLLYNLLYTSLTKIPQTDIGTHLLVTTVESACSQGVINGLLAPGVWNSGGFGKLSQGDFLPKGFYVYVAPVALQNPADRAARKSPPIQVAVKLAGAIHTIDVQINVNR